MQYICNSVIRQERKKLKNDLNRMCVKNTPFFLFIIKTNYFVSIILIYRYY